MLGRNFALLTFLAQVLSMGAGGCLMAGCSMFPSEMSQMTAMVVDKVADQGMLDKWASNMEAHVNNPGIETGVVIRIAGYGRFIGTDGQVSLGTEGGGTDLAPGERDALIRLLELPGLDEAARMAILKRLGWHRGEGDVDPP